MAPDLSEDFRARSIDMGPERWLDADGVKTRYFDAGQGAPVVLIHGGNFGSADGLTARSWDLNFGVLAQYANAIAFERLGQGFTGLPKRDADYTMDASVQHSAAFLRALGKGPYHLVGHSRGAYIVTRLAMEHPDLVRTVVCISSGTLSPFIGRNHIVHADMPAWSTRANVRAIYELYSWDRRVITEALLDEFESVVARPEFREAYDKMAVQGLDRSLFQPSLGRQRKETQQWLMAEGMPCPTLIVWAHKDPTALFENGRTLVEMYMRKQPQTSLHLFNRSGHFVFREYAEQFNRLVYGLISSH